MEQYGSLISWVILAVVLLLPYIFSSKEKPGGPKPLVYRGVDFSALPAGSHKEQVEWVRREKQKGYKKDPQTGKTRLPKISWAQETLRHWQAYQEKIHLEKQIAAGRQPDKEVRKSDDGGWVAPLPKSSVPLDEA